MINRLVVENLKHRPVRTFLSIFAIGIEVVMILTLVGVSRGMLDDSQRRAKGVGADIWIKPPTAGILSLSSAMMSEKLIDFFGSQPGVEMATGSLVQSVGSGLDNVQGIDLAQFDRMSGGFKYLEGGPFQDPRDLLVDERFASQNRLSVGSKWTIMNREWRVCGIVEGGKLTRLFLPLKVVQDLTTNTARVSQIFVKLKDAGQTDATVETFKKNPALAGYGIYSIEEYTSRLSISKIDGLRGFIGVVIFVSVTVGFIVVALSMYTAVLERTREIGILKSLGAQPGYILGILLRETAVLAICGSILGILMSYGTQFLIKKFAGHMLVQYIVYDWWQYTTLLSIVGALLGTLYPAWIAVKQDTLEALSYD